MTLEDLLRDAQTCPAVPAAAADAYIAQSARMTEDVDRRVLAHPACNRLIGRNPLHVMRDNHRNHAVFMATVFAFNNLELLCRVVPWVYRAYDSRGFSFDYFPVELEAWQDTVRAHLDAASAEPILAVYAWMAAHHADWIDLSRSHRLTGEGLPELGKDQGAQAWTRLLLTGNTRKCLALAAESGSSADAVAGLYLDTLQPALYDIGSRWEDGSVSVAQEHLATAIVSRVMASMYEGIPWPAEALGAAVVTCAPGEYHEIGARMVADLLEMDGWDVTFLGANTPEADVLKLLAERRPELLGISVSMPFNLMAVRDLIAQVRRLPDLASLRIMVGGLGTGGIASLWQSTGADGWAADARDAVSLARRWRTERVGTP